MIYKSTKPDTLFIDEECVDEIGRFSLYIDDGNEYGVNERIFEVKMEFGGTFLNAVVEHKNSGTIKKLEFNY